MLRPFLRCKIHRATVTDADLNYVGSITIDQTILKAAGLLPNEKVQVVNNNNGARLETYIIPGKPGSGVICLNGAAARLAQKGDIVIIMAYALMSEKELSENNPVVVLLDEHNQVKQFLSEKPMQFL
ncbi:MULTISPECIES: aspartate 1-decarboxylase [unclassified Sporolactobacillus]|uniref:aspartate 1-decarboxylase n=1 Tax=unclassified Sporolactobacillus TaxID=2628533 RepID=UPI0023676D91|nr:aspartate 1-decarboxylase [Sporolactobacillus sp. CQH2019]MDD9148727.1 aspartate 1-decarboxylase [Sporolactobacillus sp. CQH2019]